jgi:hypothetical protein
MYIASSHIINKIGSLLSLNTMAKSASKAPTYVTLAIFCKWFIYLGILLYILLNILLK